MKNKRNMHKKVYKSSWRYLNFFISLSINSMVLISKGTDLSYHGSKQYKMLFHEIKLRKYIVVLMKHETSDKSVSFWFTILF